MESIKKIKNAYLYIFFLFLFILIIIYISHKVGKEQVNCNIIKTTRTNKHNNIFTDFYNIEDLIRNNYFVGKLSVSDSTIDYNYKLKDFYIKTAYNCFCNGNNRNDFVNKCAMENCASYGVRALDLQIFSKNGIPIVGSSSLSVNSYKQSYNDIKLDTALSHINKTYFEDSTWEIKSNEKNNTISITNNLKNDPLFLFFRIHYGSDDNTYSYDSETIKKYKTAFYNKIYNILKNNFDNSKFNRIQFIKLYGEDYNRLDKVSSINMKDTKNRIFIFVIINDNSYDEIKDSFLNELVDIYGDEEFEHYRINDMLESNSSYNKYKSKDEIMYCMPSWSNYSTNYDFTEPMKKGTQFIGMNYQTNDKYLYYYNKFFVEQHSLTDSSRTCCYIKKPDHMIDLPIKIQF